MYAHDISDMILLKHRTGPRNA